MPINTARIQENLASLTGVLAVLAFILLARFKKTVDDKNPQDAWFFVGISLVFAQVFIGTALAVSLRREGQQRSGSQREVSNHSSEQPLVFRSRNADQLAIFK